MLETVHDLGLLFLGQGIGCGKVDHPGAVGPLVAAGVDQGLGAVGIAAKDIGQWFPRNGHRLAVCVVEIKGYTYIGQSD